MLKIRILVMVLAGSMPICICQVTSSHKFLVGKLFLLISICFAFVHLYFCKWHGNYFSIEVFNLV